MQKQSTPFSQSRPYLKNYFTLIKEYEKNKATLLKEEEPKKPIVKIIEDIYNKYSSNLESYMQKNKGKLQLYGSTKYENATIEAFIEELQSYKQTIIKQIKSNPLVSANMNHPFPSEEIILTPLPDQPRKLLKEKKDKAEFDSAERTAVVMRVVEYTHRLTLDNKNLNSVPNGQKFRNRKKIEVIYDNRSVFIIMKKAVNVIQIWWKGIKKDKTRNIKVNRFVWLVQLYIKRRIINTLNSIQLIISKEVEIIDKQSDMNIMLKGNKSDVKRPVKIIRNIGNENEKGLMNKITYWFNGIEKQMRMVTFLRNKIKQWLIRKGNKKLINSKVKVIMKCYKKPIVLISYGDKVRYSLTQLLFLQKHFLTYFSRIKLNRLKKEALYKPFCIQKVLPLMITKKSILLESECIYKRVSLSQTQMCFITKEIINYAQAKIILPLCFITKTNRVIDVLSTVTENKVKSEEKTELIYQRLLISNQCVITKENRLIESNIFLLNLWSPQICLITKERKRIIHILQKELIPLSLFTKEIKINQYTLQRQILKLCFVSKETIFNNESNQRISDFSLDINPISIIKLKPFTIFKVIKSYDKKALMPQRELINICYQTKTKILFIPTKSVNINQGVNTDCINKSDQYEITKVYDHEYCYRDFSSLIHTISYVINNHLNDYFMTALIEYSNYSKRQKYLLKSVLLQEEKLNNLLPYLRTWQYKSSICNYSNKRTCDKSNTFSHSFTYKSKLTQFKSKKPILYQLRTGIKLICCVCFKLSFNSIKSKTKEYKCNRFIHLISQKKKKELLYRLMLNHLLSQSIDINRISVITLLKYGMNNHNPYHHRLNEILKLNLTDNNSKSYLTFSNYIRKLIENKSIDGEREDDDGMTEKESINGDESIPEEINQLYLCRNKHLTPNKRCITSPETSEDEHKRQRKINDYTFTPVKGANKSDRHTNISKRLFPKQPTSPQQSTILLRELNIIDQSII